MKRYNSQIAFLDMVSKKSYYPSIRFPQIPNSITDIYIIGSYHDRLDNLAWNYYKDTSLWWIIAEANEIGRGDLLVPVGKQIRIPIDIRPIIDDYISINNLLTVE